MIRKVTSAVVVAAAAAAAFPATGVVIVAAGNSVAFSFNADPATAGEYVTINYGFVLSSIFNDGEADEGFIRFFDSPDGSGAPLGPRPNSDWRVGSVATAVAEICPDERVAFACDGKFSVTFTPTSGSVELQSEFIRQTRENGELESIRTPGRLVSTPVPEPATLALVGVGALGLLVAGRLRRGKT